MIFLIVFVTGLTMAYQAKEYNPVLQPKYVKPTQKTIMIEENARMQRPLFEDGP